MRVLITRNLATIRTHTRSASSMLKTLFPALPKTATAPVVTMRRATIADAKPLIAIINSAYRSDKNWTNESKLVKDERIMLQELETLISAGVDPILVAEHDNQPVGCIKVDFCRNHPHYKLPDDAALIGLLAVHSEYQSTGIGRTLGDAAMEFAKVQGKCSKAMLFVINKRLDIQAWYERRGFTWKGDKRDFVSPDKALQDDIWFKSQPAGHCAIHQPATTPDTQAPSFLYYKLRWTATPVVIARRALVVDANPFIAIVNTAYWSDKNWTNESELAKDERITLQELQA
ncbi:N-acetyltransferase gcn5, partial [Globisporangium splendens]